MDSPIQIFWGITFSSIGLGYFIYGKKQMTMTPLICGLCLMIYPYFVSNTWALVFIGLLLSGLPYFFRR